MPLSWIPRRIWRKKQTEQEQGLPANPPEIIAALLNTEQHAAERVNEAHEKRVMRERLSRIATIARLIEREMDDE